MIDILARTYDKLILKRPVLSLCLCLLAIGVFAGYIGDFKLDASGDSLVLGDLDGDENAPSSWGASEQLHGSPGEYEKAR